MKLPREEGVHMNARMKEKAKRRAMRMLICTVMCLFALSSLMVTAYATDGEGSSLSESMTTNPE